MPVNPVLVSETYEEVHRQVAPDGSTLVIHVSKSNFRHVLVEHFYPIQVNGVVSHYWDMEGILNDVTPY